MRKKVAVKTQTTDKQQIEEPQASSAITPAERPLPLVFVSHHADDADLAEAFGNLLADLTSGLLRCFRSTDHKGTSGIGFGKEWYSFVMEKLGDATDVVALLTETSMDRPWILFEAGVAKGKSDETPVFGLVIGVPVGAANNGPFAQFQNCGCDEASLMKLVMQLIRRMPGAAPREEFVREQVAAFKKKIDAILKQRPDRAKQPEQPTVDDDAVARLFEEVKVMLRDLPDEIRGRRRRRMDPFMLEEMLHMSMRRGGKPDRAVAWLMFISMFRDEYPWFYELGMEVYRALRQGTPRAAHMAARRMREIAEFTMRGPWGEEFGVDPDTHMMLRHLPEMLDRYLVRPEASERGTGQSDEGE